MLCSGEGIGYYLGLIGGILMIMLYLYPLKKHFKFSRNWGHSKYWFWVHVFLGLTGPLLILAHTMLDFRSINASVAFTVMLLVAISGVIGRFGQVNKASQFWHVVHVPFSYLLFFCVLAHVIWVHMY
jgi:hypothetical protein